jgi:hypothetical protein
VFDGCASAAPDTSETESDTSSVDATTEVRSRMRARTVLPAFMLRILLVDREFPPMATGMVGNVSQARRLRAGACAHR